MNRKVIKIHTNHKLHRRCVDGLQAEKTTFVSWLCQYCGEDHAIGHLAQDVKIDRSRPRATHPSQQDYVTWHRYLESNNACIEAVMTLDEAYLAFAALRGVPIQRSPHPTHQDMEAQSSYWLWSEWGEDYSNWLYTKNKHPQTSGLVVPRLRFQILKRDNYRCRLCGAAATDGASVQLEVDHITPRRHGGTNDPSNLWTLCFACNRGKGTKEL